jgi:hypothetical protein
MRRLHPCLSPRIARRVSVGVVLSLTLACGGGSGSSSNTPTGPSAGASATPTPSPTPGPTPTPSLGLACQGIPDGTGSPRGCAKGNPDFYNQVKDAVELAMSTAVRDPNTGASYAIVQDGKIISPSAYLGTITDSLGKQGLCAAWDGEEINVRNGGGAFNENYDVITSDGRAWINYNATCTPALPMPQPPAPPLAKAPDCSLPASASTFCIHDTPAYDGDVFGAQDDLIAEDQARATPQVFDFGDRLSNTSYGYKIINDSLYVQGMLQKLKARGYCAFFDGEEFEVKKGTNTLSENYDLTKSDGYAIRLYEVSCRDAGF